MIEYGYVHVSFSLTDIPSHRHILIFLIKHSNKNIYECIENKKTISNFVWLLTSWEQLFVQYIVLLLQQLLHVFNKRSTREEKGEADAVVCWRGSTKDSKLYFHSFFFLLSRSIRTHLPALSLLCIDLIDWYSIIVLDTHHLRYST